jgi:hypothetical protein
VTRKRGTQESSAGSGFTTAAAGAVLERSFRPSVSIWTDSVYVPRQTLTVSFGFAASTAS